RRVHSRRKRPARSSIGGSVVQPTSTPRPGPGNLPAGPLAMLVLVIASLVTSACDELVHLGGATGPPPIRGGAVQQYSSATTEEHIHFDAGHMVATRHVSFEVDNRDPNVRTIMLSASSSIDGPPL